MRMTELAILFLTATLNFANSAVLATDSGTQSNNDQVNAVVDTGQVVLDTRENIVPNNVGNNGVNIGSGGTVLHPDDSSTNNNGMIKDERHKNTMYEDGRCPDIDKKVQAGNGINNDVDAKTGGTTQ